MLGVFGFECFIGVNTGAERYVRLASPKQPEPFRAEAMMEKRSDMSVATVEHR